ncbi:MAG: hypothetical protein ACLPQS_13190 [Acidimicrobiales bacterium]
METAREVVVELAEVEVEVAEVEQPDATAITHPRAMAAGRTRFTSAAPPHLVLWRGRIRPAT